MSKRLEDWHPDVGAYLARRVAEFNQIRMQMVAEDCAVLKEEFGVEGNVRDAVTDRYVPHAALLSELVHFVTKKCSTIEEARALTTRKLKMELAASGRDAAPAQEQAE